MSPAECLFCKLKNVKENIIFEDEELYVILDRFPLSNRHLLIIPKTHCHTLTELDDKIICSTILLAKKLAKWLDLEKYNLIQNNINEQLVPHMHLHLIGCNETGKFMSGSKTSLALDDQEYSKIANEIKVLLNKK